jgi:serine/threonine-protein kinase HipA
MADRYELAAWLYGVPAAVIRERRTGKISLDYTDEAVERWDYGTPVLSVGLPLNPERKYPPAKVAPFLEGLLPEGAARTTIETRFGVRRGDTFGLVAEIGRDCAGAVTFQPRDDSPPPFPVPPQLEIISDADVTAEIDALSSYPLGADDQVRVSLAGQQDKLLLTRSPEGRWARPIGSTPSTHILKPQDERYPSLVANEAFCLRAAREVGLTSIDIDEFDAGGRSVLVVSRYDRSVLADGTIIRIHQEDFCQALGIPPREAAKYESHGGPSLRAVAAILDTWAGRVEALDQLARVMLFNVAVGNADAHGKNLALLHGPDAGITLAPLYDVISTVYYQSVSTRDGLKPASKELAMTIDGVTHVNEVTVEDLVREAVSWTYNKVRAERVLGELVDRLPKAIETAAASTRDVPDDLVASVTERVRSLSEGQPAGKSGS